MATHRISGFSHSLPDITVREAGRGVKRPREQQPSALPPSKKTKQKEEEGPAVTVLSNLSFIPPQIYSQIALVKATPERGTYVYQMIETATGLWKKLKITQITNAAHEALSMNTDVGESLIANNFKEDPRFACLEKRAPISLSNGEKLCAEIAPYIKGQDLFNYLIELRNNHKTLSLAQCLDLAIQITEIFRDLHNKRIIHRDLKPENLIITPEGKIVLIDMEFAKTMSGSISPRGSVEYGAPEAFTPPLVENNYDKLDSFPFGLVLYSLCNPGTLPLKAQKYAAESREITQLKEMPEHLQCLSPIILSLLKRNPAERLSFAEAYEKLVEIRDRPASASSSSSSSASLPAGGVLVEGPGPEL